MERLSASNNVISIDAPIDVDTLACIMKKHHSFSFMSFNDARMTVNSPNMACCFDRLTLNVYSSNLNAEKSSHLTQLLNTRFFNHLSNADLQTHKEYVSLFHLISELNFYNDCIIRKNHRPDFILKGKLKIGIEETELTTSQTKLLHRISAENFGKNLTSDKIRYNAIKKHGKKINDYKFFSIGSTVAIARPVFNFKSEILTYALEITKKYKKYKQMFSEFDLFVILCNARDSICVSDHDDATQILSTVKTLVPDISGFRLQILWIDASNKSMVSTFNL